jgi:hypothetical protein
MDWLLVRQLFNRLLSPAGQEASSTYPKAGLGGRRMRGDNPAL